MPTSPSESGPAKCKRCTSELPAGALVCKRCHTLVHAEELEQAGASAKTYEEQGDRVRAREQWLRALELLPGDSRQAAWVRAEAERVAVAPPITVADSKDHQWAGKLAPVAAIVFALSKGKALLAIFNMKFLLSLGAFLWTYWTLYGMRFGLGFTVHILLHELGHYVDIKRRGLPADMPVFLPGLGAYVRWRDMGVSLQTRAAISLAGPLAGLLASAVCLGMWLQTGDGLWAALARTGAWLNVLNLIPIWALDGGQAFLALSKTERGLVLAASLVLVILLGEGVFLLVALGAGYRLFTKDAPGQASPATTAYFVLLLIGFGVLKWLAPGGMFDAP